jgi:WD40 repeat protein
MRGADAADWADDGREPQRLWRHGQLAAALADTGARLERTSGPHQLGPSGVRWRPGHRSVVTDRVELSGRAREFLQRSVRRDRRRRRRATSILSVLLLIALAGSGVALDRQQAAQEQQRIATARQLVAQAEAARGNDPRAALQLGLAAQSVHPDVDTRASLAATVAGTRYTGTLPGQSAGGAALAFARNRSLLAVGGVEKRVVLWDLTDPLRPLQVGQPLTGYDGVVWSAEFSPDGHVLATGTTVSTEVRDGSGSVVGLTDEALVILWDVTDPSQARRLSQPVVATTDPAPGGEGITIASVTFSPDGRTLVVNNGSAVGLWDVTDPERPGRIGGLSTGQEGGVSAAVFAPDGPLLATAGDDGQVGLWNLADPAHPRRVGALPSRTGPINGLAFAPDTPLLATAGDDGQVALWDLTDPVRPLPVGDPLTGHVGGVEAVAFSPAGHLLASAGSDSTVALWEVVDRQHVRRLGQPLVSHVGGVGAVAFAPGGATLISSGLDRTVVWDVTARAQPRVLPGGTVTGDSGQVSAVAFARARDLLATASDHDTVILWDLSNPAHPRRIGRPLAGGRSRSPRTGAPSRASVGFGAFRRAVGPR